MLLSKRKAGGNINYTAIMTGSERVSSIQGYEGRTTSGSETKKLRSRVRVRRYRERHLHEHDGDGLLLEFISVPLVRQSCPEPASLKDARPRSQRQKSVDRMEEKASWNCPHVEIGFGVEGTICSLGSRQGGKRNVIPFLLLLLQTMHTPRRV